MELRSLNYFLTVAREKNISKAANILHISQPSLSKQLQNLEEELGKKLFNRTNRGIVLTEEGLHLQKRTEEILDLVEKTENELKEENLKGDIYFGAAESKNIKLLTDFFKDLRKDVNFNLHIISGNNIETFEKLEKGLVDFGFILALEDEDLVNYEVLTLPVKEKWGLLFNRKSNLSKKEILTIQDLKDKNLIISNELNKPEYFKKLFGSDPLDNIVATYSLIYNASIMVKSGIGSAITLEGLIKEDENVIFKPIKTITDTEVKIIYKNEERLSKSSKYFLKELKNYLKDLK